MYNLGMKSIRQIFIESGYSVPTAYSFTNGNRNFLSKKQKIAIKKAISIGLLNELLSLPTKNNNTSSSKTSRTNESKNLPKAEKC